MLPAMRRLVAQSRMLALGGVVCAVAAALLAFIGAAIKLAKLVVQLVHGDVATLPLGLVQALDVILIGAGLLIIAIGIYELFVGRLEVPDGIQAASFDALKNKLAGIAVLVMVVSFIERLETVEDPRDVLASGVAVALVSAALIAFARPHKP
jgi:uncharacterized membrane protein YqhA